MRDRRLDQETRYTYKPPKRPETAPEPDPLAWATSGPGNTAIGHTGQPRGCSEAEARAAVEEAVEWARAEVDHLADPGKMVGGPRILDRAGAGRPCGKSPRLAE